MGRYADFFADADRWCSPRVGEHVGATPATPADGEAPVVHDYWSSREFLRCRCLVQRRQARRRPRRIAAAADELGYPVTLKLSAAAIVHKAAAGAVRLYLRDRDAVREAAQEMLTRSPGARVVVESFTPSVAMALLGGHRDAELAPLCSPASGAATRSPTAT